MAFRIGFSRPGQVPYLTVYARQGSHYGPGELAPLGGTVEMLRGDFCGAATVRLNAPPPIRPGDWLRVWLPGDAADDPTYLGEVTSEVWPEGPGEVQARALTTPVSRARWIGAVEARFQAFVQAVLGKLVLPPGVHIGSIPYETAVLKADTPFELLGDTLQSALPVIDGGTWGVNGRAEIGVYRPVTEVLHRFVRGQASLPLGNTENYANAVRFPYKLPDGSEAWFEGRITEEVAARGEVWEVTQAPARVTEAIEKPLLGMSGDVALDWTLPNLASGTLHRTLPVFDPAWTGSLGQNFPTGSKPLAGQDLTLTRWEDATLRYAHIGEWEFRRIGVYRTNPDGTTYTTPTLAHKLYLHGVTPGIPLRVTMTLEVPVIYQAQREDRSFETRTLPTSWSQMYFPNSADPVLDVTAGMQTFDPYRSDGTPHLSTSGGNSNEMNNPQSRQPRLITMTVEYAPNPGVPLPARGFDIEPIWGEQRNADPIYNQYGDGTRLGESTLWSNGIYPTVSVQSVDNQLRASVAFTTDQRNLGQDRPIKLTDVLAGLTSGFTLSGTATVRFPAPLLMQQGSAVAVRGTAGSVALVSTSGVWGDVPLTAGDTTNGETRWKHTGTDLNVAALKLTGDLNTIGPVQPLQTSQADLAAYAYGLLRYRTQPVRSWAGRYSTLKRVPCRGLARFDTSRGDVDLDVQRVVYDLGAGHVTVEAGTPLARSDGEAVAAAIESVRRETRQAGGGS